jgi:flagellar hook-associated protein 2
MAGMSVSTGLISGMDTASLISQLMQVEANPQTLLRTRLTETKADAAAYRDVNTKFDALRSAADALTQVATWAAAKAGSSSASVTATASSTATPGSLTFTVGQLAAPHSVLSAQTWQTAATPFGTGSPLLLTPQGGSAKQIPLKAGATLADAVVAINGANAGVTAMAVSTTTGYRLQVTSTTSGAASTFSLAPTGGSSSDFPTLTAGANATITVGDPATTGFIATSSSNNFTELMPGSTVSVSQTGGPVTVTVSSDPDAVAKAVQTLVTAANNVLTSIAKYTDTSANSTAVLKGDSALRRLTDDVIMAVSGAIGTNSAGQAGVQLNKDGGIVFDASAFTAKLKSNPDLVQSLVNGTATVPGVAQRLLTVAKRSTDTTSGTLVLLAKSQDTAATSLQQSIDSWDIRLALRKDTLTRQFTAMESALGTLQSQGSWLSSQIASLPNWSSSSK